MGQYPTFEQGSVGEKKKWVKLAHDMKLHWRIIIIPPCSIPIARKGIIGSKV